MFLRSVLCLVLFVACTMRAQVQQQTFKLTDGGTVIGRIIAPQDKFLQVALDTGGGAPVYTNINWARLSQDTLKSLANIRTVAPFANAFIDPPASGVESASPKKISIKTPPRLDRPTGGNIFASPVMLVVLFLVYVANIYAGWEIGVFRQWPAAMTAGVAAVIPILGPLIFIAMPTHRPHQEHAVDETAHMEEAPVEVVEEAPAPVVEEASSQPTLPPAVIYARGQFTFNRRFFETKFAGFLKVVLGEAEKEKVIYIKSARGEYTGQRLSKVEQNELYLQVFKGGASEEIMIPFTEIYEVQIKHKDA